jgi:cold shock CspA family protein
MQKGILRKWDDAKGFGFIRNEENGEDIFFHISSLHRSDRRPIVGDILYFNIVNDHQGRKSAGSVSIQGIKSVFDDKPVIIRTGIKYDRPASRTRAFTDTAPKAKRKANFSKRFNAVIFLVVGIALFQGYQKFSTSPSNIERSVSLSANVIEALPIESSGFQCTGKNRCNEMTSCAEAKFYLNNCPGSLTDGDGDGLPCEDQWCGH